MIQANLQEHLGFSLEDVKVQISVEEMSTKNLGFCGRYHAGICNIFDRPFDPYGW